MHHHAHDGRTLVARPEPLAPTGHAAPTASPPEAGAAR